MAEITCRYVRPTYLPALTAIMSDFQVVRQLGSWPWPQHAAFTATRCQPYAGNCVAATCPDPGPLADLEQSRPIR
jgi:hypothetical protein